MKPSQFTSTILNHYPQFSQETRDFYIDLLIGMPYSEHITGFKLGIDVAKSESYIEQVEPLSNISIITFDIIGNHIPMDLYCSITSFLQDEYFGEDIVDFNFMHDTLLIKFQY